MNHTELDLQNLFKPQLKIWRLFKFQFGCLPKFKFKQGNGIYIVHYLHTLLTTIQSDIASYFLPAIYGFCGTGHGFRNNRKAQW